MLRATHMTPLRLMACALALLWGCEPTSSGDFGDGGDLPEAGSGGGEAGSGGDAGGEAGSGGDAGGEAGSGGEAGGDPEPPEWGYDDEHGPDSWGAVEGWELCATGLEQSPVDIPRVASSSHPAMELAYAPTAATLEDNGHTIHVGLAEGNALTVGEESWDLRHIQFHAGSEHTLEGERFAMEIHLTHEDAEGGLAVVALLVEEGEAHPSLSSLFEALEAGEVEFDPSALLPETLGSWRYNGSLTTPPCTEGVRWFVMSAPIQASAEQIAAFTALYDGNYRPTQPLNDRVIEAPHWGYEEDEMGPLHWAELSPEWSACAEGQAQSPIDIPAVSPSGHPSLEFAYAESGVALVNNGHSVQANYDAGSALTVDGHEWALKQIHLHAGSEHTVAGEQAPLEAHFVHQDAEGNLAVVGLLFEVGEADNPALDPIFGALPIEVGAEVIGDGAMLDAAALLPAERWAWRYEGSLTTPPCTEGVSWFILSEPAPISAAQLEAFTALYDHNFRPTQPLNDRVIEAPHWGYEGDVGPDHWAELSPEWGACAEGEMQSPVDIPAVSPSGHPSLQFAYQEGALSVVNNGHSVQVDVPEGSALSVAEHDWGLLQVHLHAGSEHTVEGEQAPLEAHFVHEDAEGNLAVVGLLFELGEEDNPALADLFANLPAEPGEPMLIDGVVFDPSALLPEARWAWRYEGSLTTPPCTEGVSWFILSERAPISEAQLALFTALYDGNFRPTQEMGERVIDPPQWSYEGETGPERWAELSPEWVTCGEGERQSPVDLPAMGVGSPSLASTNYGEVVAESILNNGRGIQVNLSGGVLSEATFTWDLVHVEFHAHGEHTVDGLDYPLEAHLVHANADGEVAIFSVLFEEGELDNPGIQAIWDQIPDEGEPVALEAGGGVDLSMLLPEGALGARVAHWRYLGSLTTPPCSEGVHWFVSQAYGSISTTQLDALRGLYDGNFRPTQPLGARVVNQFSGL